MDDTDPPDIPEPEFPTHSVPEPESSVRPGLHAPEPQSVDPNDPSLPAEIDFTDAWELVAKARHVKHLTSRNPIDPAWLEIRLRVADLHVIIRENKDSKSRRLLHEIESLLGLSHHKPPADSQL